MRKPWYTQTKGWVSPIAPAIPQAHWRISGEAAAYISWRTLCRECHDKGLLYLSTYHVGEIEAVKWQDLLRG